MRRALGEHHAGRLAEAEAGYREVLAKRPDHFQALRLLGVLAGQAGRPQVALELLTRATALNPGDLEVRINLASILLATRNFGAAAAACRQALLLRPDYPPAHHFLGIALYGAGQVGAAVAQYQEALRLKPEYPEAWVNLGIALQARGTMDEAVAAYREAVRLNPTLAVAYYNLGNVFKATGRLSEAAAAYESSLRLDPHQAEACNNFGNVLQAREQFEEAIRLYREALQINPEHLEALNNLGNALHGAGRLDEARDSFARLVSLRPEFAAGHLGLGNCHRDQGQPEIAVAYYRRAVALDPGAAAVRSNLIYGLMFAPDADAATLLAEQLEWDRQHAQSLKPFIRVHSNDPSPDRRLRIGYVSPDFRDHVVGCNVLPLLREHDRVGFEIFCYSNVLVPDGLTERFRALADGWRDISGLSDLEAAETIRADRIDILVDLALHMGRNRLLTFAQKPAPVQVTFAGYPGGTGLEAMDYRLTDPFLDPPGLSEAAYREASVRLPHCFWCYDPVVMTFGMAPPLPVAPLPALNAGYVTFGFLGNFCKVNAAMLRVWARLLGSVPKSRLLLSAAEGSHRETVRDTFRRDGIGPERIDFVAHAPRGRYLLQYNRIDIGLDTIPYHGHTTSLDALWMGVPVVTLVGGTVVGRAGLSQLSNLGLTELVAKTPEEYVQVAAALAHDLPRLSHLRSTLRSRMAASPLQDAVAFTRGIEDAFRKMWRDRVGKPLN